MVMRPTKHAKPKEHTPGILCLHGGGHTYGMAPGFQEKILLSGAHRLVDEYGAVVIAPNYRGAAEEAVLCSEDLERCEEAFVTNSLMGVMPVCSIDGRQLPSQEHACALLER